MTAKRLNFFFKAHKSRMHYNIICINTIYDLSLVAAGQIKQHDFFFKFLHKYSQISEEIGIKLFDAFSLMRNYKSNAKNI